MGRGLTRSWACEVKLVERWPKNTVTNGQEKDTRETPSCFVWRARTPVRMSRIFHGGYNFWNQITRGRSVWFSTEDVRLEAHLGILAVLGRSTYCNLVSFGSLPRFGGGASAYLGREGTVLRTVSDVLCTLT